MYIDSYIKSEQTAKEHTHYLLLGDGGTQHGGTFASHIAFAFKLPFTATDYIENKNKQIIRLSGGGIIYKGKVSSCLLQFSGSLAGDCVHVYIWFCVNPQHEKEGNDSTLDGKKLVTFLGQFLPLCVSINIDIGCIL